MIKNIELPDLVLEQLEAEAKKQKRSLKAHMEYVLIMESNKYSIIKSLKK